MPKHVAGGSRFYGSGNGVNKIDDLTKYSNPSADNVVIIYSKTFGNRPLIVLALPALPALPALLALLAVLHISYLSHPSRNFVAPRTPRTPRTSPLFFFSGPRPLTMSRPPRFSPFDALGLKFGRYNPSEIGKAFRRASLHAHPDKRPFSSVDRWPTQVQVNLSRDFLLEGDNHAKYQGYPRRFFPENGGEAAYQELPNSPFNVCSSCASVIDCLCGSARVAFSVCATCGMVLQSDCLRDHQQSEHKIYECDICGDTSASESDLTKHQQLEHIICDHCGKMVDLQFAKQHIREHTCKICKEVHADMIEHLEKDHLYEIFDRSTPGSNARSRPAMKSRLANCCFTSLGNMELFGAQHALARSSTFQKRQPTS
ncbi:hypothetical protein QBC36DRAFT_383018 [Triangularia setosa]|uniref:J domain-containing protein n=1 Tax=Triangularia setosa TaxID=2587417 RepID=A0AAN6VYC5_9PEZI|nr:hypothetical protein QBC36DRAFT_383018 [Podospora setosa]